MIKRFTPDKLRTFAGFEKCSDEEAVEIIEQLERLSYIIMSISLKNQRKIVAYIRSDSLNSASKQKEILDRHLGARGIEPVYVVEGKGNKSESEENQRESTEQESN